MAPNILHVRGRKPRIHLLAVSIIAASLLQARAADIEYAYDPAGRLVGVVDGAGDVAQYVYDPAGNITEIKRFAATTLSVVEFAPRSGAPGAQVTIWGSGFSTTPSSNVVTFNGGAATVTSATRNKLIVTVPAGATSGTIAVTVSSNTANSSSQFVVAAAVNCASRLTGLAPTVAVGAATVAVSGSAFDRGPNVVTMNGSAASSSATSSTLTATVPSGATSGRVMVSTAPVCGPTADRRLRQCQPA